MIGIAADHGGFLKKEELIKYLKELNFEVIDYSSKEFDPLDDEPIFAIKLGEAIRDNKIKVGVALCTTGIGMSIACNKVKKVRCAKVDSEADAMSSRKHNNANIIALAGTKDINELKKFVTLFLETDFLKEERLIRRIEEISEYELNEY